MSVRSVAPAPFSAETLTFVASPSSRKTRHWTGQGGDHVRRESLCKRPFLRSDNAPNLEDLLLGLLVVSVVIHPAITTDFAQRRSRHETAETTHLGRNGAAESRSLATKIRRHNEGRWCRISHSAVVARGSLHRSLSLLPFRLTRADSDETSLTSHTLTGTAC